MVWRWTGSAHRFQIWVHNLFNQATWNMQFLSLRDNKCVCIYFYLSAMTYFSFLFFNAIAANTFVYYKHEVCLITIIKTSVLLYIPFLKWIFLLLPQQNNWIYVWLLTFIWISISTISRVILFLTIISFKIYPVWIGEDKSCFTFWDKEMCSHSYGLQAALMRSLKTVHRRDID